MSVKRNVTVPVGSAGIAGESMVAISCRSSRWKRSRVDGVKPTDALGAHRRGLGFPNTAQARGVGAAPVVRCGARDFAFGDRAMTDDRELTDSYFVANVRALRWQENRLGATCEFDKHRERFPEFGINLTVLQPGRPMTMSPRALPRRVPRTSRRVPADRQGPGSAARAVGLLPLSARRCACDRGGGHATVPRLGRRQPDRPRRDPLSAGRDGIEVRRGVEQETPHAREAYGRFTRPAPDVPFREES